MAQPTHGGGGYGSAAIVVMSTIPLELQLEYTLVTSQYKRIRCLYNPLLSISDGKVSTSPTNAPISPYNSYTDQLVMVYCISQFREPTNGYVAGMVDNVFHSWYTIAMNTRDLSAGVWAVVNPVDKRIWINSSRVIQFGFNDLLRKLYYKDIRINRLVIQDYWSNKLQHVVLEYCQDDPIIRNMIIRYWIDHYRSLGFNVINTKICKGFFVHIEPRTYLSLNGSERLLVFVSLKRKRKVTKEVIVGVFNTMKEAREWSRWAYGSYDKYAIDRIVVNPSTLTKNTLVNPVLMDRNLMDLYKRVYE